MTQAETKPDRFEHQTIDQKWQKRWADSQRYRTPEKPGREKMYVLDMFPYPSGEGLHVGHPLGYIGSDIVARYLRAQGKQVLHPMGFDSFGLPAENYAIISGVHPAITTAKAIERYRAQLQMIGLSYDWEREINTCDPAYYRWTQWLFLQLFQAGLAYRAKAPVNWCPHCQTVLANEQVIQKTEDRRQKTEANRLAAATRDSSVSVCERCDTPVEHKELDQWFFKTTAYAEELLAAVDELDWPEPIKIMQRNWIGRSEGSLLRFEIKNQKSKIKNTRQKAKVIEVFTTRPDTLFGATYLVLAPEHPFVDELLTSQNTQYAIRNTREVQNYFDETRTKTELERKSDDKDKSGVELTGVMAINPATNEEISIWVADYVLGNYGTGAIMAVPAHDERDYAFAKKYQLPIKQVVAPHLVDHANPPRADKRDAPRIVVQGVVRHWQDDTVLQIAWKKQPWKTFVIGGAEKDEDLAAAIKREVQEETGYKNFKSIRKIGWEMRSEWFAKHKDENRFARMHVFELVLADDKRDEISVEEREKHELRWVPFGDIPRSFGPVGELDFIWKFLNEPLAPFTDPGKLIYSSEFSELPSEDAKQKITEFVGGEWTTTYRLRDWLVSRQRYWGAPIPVIYCASCPTRESGIKNQELGGKPVIQRDATNVNTQYAIPNTQYPIADIDGVAYAIHPVPEDQLPVRLPEDVDFQPTGQSPLVGSKTFHAGVTCPACGAPARREVDTLDTFVDSAWYFLRYTDPHNTERVFDPELVEGWLPVDWYVGGAEHAVLHLLYARFITKALADLPAGKAGRKLVNFREPFTRLRNQGLIGGEDGRKMSKRWGNVVNPDDVVRDYGADALRCFEMFMGPFEDAKPWSTTGIVGVRRWLERIWRLSVKFRRQETGDRRQNKTIDHALHQTIAKVTEDIEGFHFNTAVSQLMILTNALEKEPVIDQDTWRTYLQILAPLAPHLAHELWERAGFTGFPDDAWPTVDSAKLATATVILPVQVNGKIRGQIEVSPTASETEVRKLAEGVPSVAKHLENKTVQKVIYVPGRILNFVVD